MLSKFNQLLISFILLAQFSCSQNTQKINLKQTINAESQKKWVDSIYNSLTLNEKVGQLFNVAIWTNKDQKHHDEIYNLIKNENIGGLIFMQDIAEKQIELTNLFQKNAKVPLLIGMDAEWGISMRLKNTHKFPFAMTLGAIQNEESMYLMAGQIAKDCKKMGVHWNFAPVSDVNTNPLNPIIGSRSFGSNKFNVVKKSAAYMNGLQDNFILSSAKHFPGHGDTETDSHKELPQVNHSKERLNDIELYPFNELVKKGIMGVMVAHLQVPSLETNPKIPSSLSKKIVTGILKEKMGYKGLIITDALNMNGVTKNFPNGETDLMAFQAGNDILLFTQAVKVGKEKIIKAIKSKKIPESRLEESVKKILSAKYFVGLNKIKDLDSTKLMDELNSSNHLKISERIYSEAITVVKNDLKNLPFSTNLTENLIHIPLEDQDYSVFEKTLNQYKNVTTISKDSLSKIPEGSKIIISVIKDTTSPYKSYTISKQNIDIIYKLAEKYSVTLVNFTSPYSLRDVNIEKIKSVVIAYQNNDFTQRIVPQNLFAARKSSGRIPVDVNDKIKEGMGIDLAENATLKQIGLKEFEKMYDFSKIDSLVLESIKNKETPSIQLLVAHKGKIIYDKSIGTTTYDLKDTINNAYLYDIASVTKVVATTSLALKAIEEKKINFEDTVEKFLPDFANHLIGKITVLELLQHKSGLVPYIPFYKELKLNETENFSTIKNELFSIQVAENLFIKNDIENFVTNGMKNTILGTKTFVYSDLNMYLLMKILEKSYSKNFEDLFTEKIKNPLGMNQTFFNPKLKNQLKIVPTEQDNYFRDQEIKGFVHDQFAGILGGVSGNAGLFSNTNDLAKIGFAFLNNGKYADFQMFNSNILKQFTTEQYDGFKESRGLGFDKNITKITEVTSQISTDSFGHYGFTGTMFWLDKKNELIYIFLSNRTFPNDVVNPLNKNRTREKILAEFYKLLK